MLKHIEELVRKCNVSDYRIVEKTTVSHQAFFVKQELDQHRVSNTTHTTLTIYMDKEVDGNKMRGQAAHEIYGSDSDEKILKEIDEMRKNALLALNPYFEIPADNKHFEEKKDFGLLDVLKTLVSAIQNVRDTETEKINSYELFANEYYYHVINSRGVDISFNTMDEEAEVIINSIDGDHEIELYHRVKFANQPLNEITDGILDVFRYAKDRTKAVPTKKMNGVTVLMSGLDNGDFFHYFIVKTNAAMIYNKRSQVQIGDRCQEGDNCDKLTVELVRELPYSSMNMPYTVEGNPARDLVLVKDGQYMNYWGDQPNSYYLGIKEAVPANNFVVSGGTRTIEEMKKDPYLEIIQFSSFVMNPMTGDFGGEIRLAYYFDGKTVTPVTGGSITCNMQDSLSSMYFSSKTRQINNCVVPQTIQVFNVNVAGEE